jgi:hypothetical protein
VVQLTWRTHSLRVLKKAEYRFLTVAAQNRY